MKVFLCLCIPLCTHNYTQPTDVNAYVLGNGYVMTNVCTPIMYHLKFFGLLLWKSYGGRILSGGYDVSFYVLVHV